MISTYLQQPNQKMDIQASLKNFAGLLYKAISSSNTSQNMFFSPASIFAAVSMTYCGSRRTTAEQIKNALGVSDNPDSTAFHESVCKIWEILHQSEEVGFEMANCMWVESSYPTEKIFQDILLNYYKADATLVDFITNPENSRKLINDWIEQKTHGKITNLLVEGTVSALTRLVITNAIYFKGNWVSEFKKGHTKGMDFYFATNKSIKASMMYQKGDFIYSQNPTYKVLVLPYVGCNVKMVVVLPNEVDGLSSVETELFEDGIGERNIQSWVTLRSTKTEVFLPKFKFSHGCDLVSTLESLGIVDLFSCGKADLSGVSGKNDLYVSSAVHKAFIDVNEEGTEAAAATAMVANSRCAMRFPVFKADHPFMFILYDKSSHTVLFMGRVYKPEV